MTTKLNKLSSIATLSLSNHSSYKGISFGAAISKPISGETVFSTGMVGYTESMTDPSYSGQILVFTHPLIGNYGVPDSSLDSYGLPRNFESNKIHVSAIIVSDYAARYSHWKAVESLASWCQRNNVPALSGVDTRAVVQTLRDNGSLLGCITTPDQTPVFEDPNQQNLVSRVSVTSRHVFNPSGKLCVAVIDCGVKYNIIRKLIEHDCQVHLLPYDHDLTLDPTPYDGIFLTNGPGDPKHCTATVENLRKVMSTPTRVPIPIFGICMGNLLLGRAAGYSTSKLPYGNRGHNQPVLNLATGECVIISQNHGYAINDSESVAGWIPYFRNANDGSNEGIRHAILPYSSVQFHPEAKGGPLDTDYLFKDFVDQVWEYKKLRQRVVSYSGKTVAYPMGVRPMVRENTNNPGYARQLEHHASF